VTTTFVLLAAALGLATAAGLTRPLWWRPAASASFGLTASLSVFVLAVAAGGYHAVGSPNQIEPVPQAAGPEQQINAMVNRLADRMKSQPDDVDGWKKLGRSYTVLGRHAQALDAFAKASQLRPDDAALLADYALAMATVNQQNFEGEPSRLIERALKMDPRQRKALAIAGAVAFDRKDYRGAVRHWEQLAQLEPADSPVAPQIQQSITQARQLAGMAISD
jgi:cytochrome c-type biogenesis protein CcmH